MKCIALAWCTFLTLNVLVSEGKVYTKCGLVEELMRLNFPRSYVAHWVCLVQSESARDTSKITNKANGSKGLGLFQISSKEWCTFGKNGGKCNLKCENLLNEDLTDDGACARTVFNQRGFSNWEGWKRGCYGRNVTLYPCC